MKPYLFMDSANINGNCIEGRFDGIYLRIYLGNYCEFNRKIPSNGMHSHQCYELCIVTAGYGEYVHGGEVLKLAKGDVFIANPQVMHEIRLRKNSSEASETMGLVYFLVYMDHSTEWTPMTNEGKILLAFQKDHCICKNNQEHILLFANFLEDYCRIGAGVPPVKEIMYRNLVLDCFVSLSGEISGFFEIKQESAPVIEAAMRYIKGCTHTRISVADVAVHTNTSVRNLQYLFRKHINKTVIEFLNERKLSIAAGYLKMNFSVGQVSELMGIHDVAQFSRMFKKHYGIPPKEYQKQHASASLVERVDNA